MSASRLRKIELPKRFRQFKMPAALHKRLQQLLDRQDREEALSAQERREAEALVDLADLLTLMRLRGDGSSKRTAS
jgi:hypothetical protein